MLILLPFSFRVVVFPAAALAHSAGEHLPANRLVAPVLWRPLQPPGRPGGRRNESGDEAVEDDATTCEAEVCIWRAFFVDSRNNRLETKRRQQKNS